MRKTGTGDRENVFRPSEELILSNFLGTMLVAASMLAASNSVLAQAGKAGAFLRLGISARAKAMGDAYTAMARGVEGSYYNPAGLPFLEKREVTASYWLLTLDREFTYIGLGFPVRPKADSTGRIAFDGGFALSWIHAGVDNIDGRDTDGQSFGDISNSEDAFVFSFALNPAEKLSLGLSVKVLWNRFPDLGIDGQTISATGVGFDFGALLTPVPWVTLGVSVRDINSQYTWNTQDLYGEDDGSETANKFPKVVRLGAAFRVPQIPHVTFAVDFEDSKELDNRMHFGAEGVFLQNLFIRGGYDDGSLTAGAGYGFGVLGRMSQINYGFATAGDRPEAEHVFSWVFQF